MFENRNPLLVGTRKVRAITAPEPLWEKLQASAALDGARSVSDYACQLLASALELRDKERIEERKSKR